MCESLKTNKRAILLGFGKKRELFVDDNGVIKPLYGLVLLLLCRAGFNLID